MDHYRPEWIHGVTPLVFAVDTTPASLHHDATPTELHDSNKAHNAFSAFYEYLTSKRQATDSSLKTEATTKTSSDPLSNTPSTDPRKSSSKATQNASSLTHHLARGSAEKSVFFSHARVVPVSHRHAFPPSKDPHGNQNAVSKLNSALYAVRNQKAVPAYDPYSDRSAKPISPVTAILAKNPIAGILPEGWIEKHTHALPSAILVVTSLLLTASSQEQARLEQHVASTIENITLSCAKKRESPIQVVCLVKISGDRPTPKELAAESERVANIKSTCRLTSGAVTCLHYYENINDGTGEKGFTFLQQDFEKVEKAVQDESMLYYLTQVRRCKRKYALLHHVKFTELQPYAVRYCIKIAMFYEFQGCVDSERRQKSATYWKEAYRILKDYYLNIKGRNGKNETKDQVKSSAESVSSIEKRQKVPMKSNENGHENSVTDELNLNDANSEYLPDDGVEVALVEPRNINSTQTTAPLGQQSDEITSRNGGKNEKASRDVLKEVGDDGDEMLTRSEDMVQQCLAVADILNIKLLSINYSYAMEWLNRPDSLNDPESRHEFTFQSLSKQIRTHIQVFLSLYNTQPGVSNHDMKHPIWLYLSFVARQRFVISEFLQRCPIPSNWSVSSDVETIRYCNAFHHYVTSGKAFLKLHAAVETSSTSTNKSGFHNILAKNDDKQRFVGCCSAHDIQSTWDKESKQDHLELALNSFRRALEVASGKGRIFARSIARVYYLMAGIHMKRHKSKLAADLLKKARSLVQGFPLIQTALDAALKECLTKVEQKYDPDFAALQLLSCEQSTLLSGNYISSLAKIAKQRDVNELKWGHSMEPFHYSFTFPRNLYASEGNIVEGMLHVSSNLPFPVKIEKIEIHTNVGKLVIDKTKTLLPSTMCRIESMVKIPVGCMKDVDAKILEKQGAKNPRRTTFGLTQIGGGVFGDTPQLSMSGGIVLACLSVDFIFSLQVGDEPRFAINLENRHRGSFPLTSEQSGNNKRSTIEEDNFVYSAWDRPDCFSVSSGPRCLRLFRANSQLEIINLTSPLVENRAMEGTVNRFVLKLQSGAAEKCRNIKMRVSCFSWINSEFSDSKNSSDGTESDKTSPLNRLPVIVEPASYPNDGECLPRWKTQHAGEWHHIAENMAFGSEYFAPVHLYRPIHSERSESDFGCMTKFTVDISYERKRLDPVYGCEIVESMLKTYQDTISWYSPVQTKFEIVPRNRYAASNVVNDVTKENSVASDKQTVISGMEVVLNCSMFCPEATSNIAVKVNRVSFEPANQENCVDVSLLNNKRLDNQTLYTAAHEDFSDQLTNGSKIKVSCLIRPEFKTNHVSEYKKILTSFGTMSIAFIPVSLRLPGGTLLDRLGHHPGKHGPLPIEDLPPFKVGTPLFYIEAAPFDVSFETIPPELKVAVPFEVKYIITNKTRRHQRLHVSMIESEGTASGMLVSGTINGALVLAPDEEKHVRYSLLIAKVGETALPTLNVSSRHYNSSFVLDCSRKVYVMP